MLELKRDPKRKVILDVPEKAIAAMLETKKPTVRDSAGVHSDRSCGD